MFLYWLFFFATCDCYRIGRPSLTIKSIIEKDVDLHGVDLSTVMLDRDTWMDFIVSPTGVG